MNRSEHVWSNTCLYLYDGSLYEQHVLTRNPGTLFMNYFPACCSYSKQIVLFTKFFSFYTIGLTLTDKEIK